MGSPFTIRKGEPIVNTGDSFGSFRLLLNFIHGGMRFFASLRMTRLVRTMSTLTSNAKDSSIPVTATIVILVVIYTKDLYNGENKMIGCN